MINIISRLESIRTKKYVIYLFFISLFIRLSYGLIYFSIFKSSNFDDDWTYVDYAHKFLEQGIFIPDISQIKELTLSLPPAFPSIIAFNFLIFGENYLPLIIINAILSAFVSVLIFYIARFLFNNKVAIMASLWSLIYVYFIRWVPFLLKENWLQFVFPLVVLILFYISKEKKYFPKIILLSFIFAFLIHLDERYFVYYPVIALGLIYLDSNNIKAGLKKASIFILLVFVFMIPWLVRNYIVFKKPVIISERTAVFTDKIFGYETKNTAPMEIQISNETLDSIRRGQNIYDITLQNELNRGIKYGLIPYRYSPLKKAFVDFKEFWRPFRFSPMFVSEGFRSEEPWSLKHNMSIMLTYGILLPFFFIGLFFVIKEKNKYAMFIIFIMLIHTLIHTTVLLSQYRYRIPIDAFVIIFSFYGIFKLFNKKVTPVENK